MKRILLFSIMLLTLSGLHAQDTDRTLMRRGNRLYADSLFIKAEENYLKAVDKNPESVEGYYNLGNSYVGQQKPNEAVESYRRAINMLEGKKKSLEENPSSSKADIEAVKKDLAQAYHNTGVVYHCSDQYDKAIESYRQALRNNPHDDETRYNLMAAMKKQQQQQQQQDQDQQQDQNQDQQQQDQNQDQQQDQNEEQQQDQQDQPQPEQEEMSEENAEQLLQSAMEDEKEVQEKVQEKLMKAAQQKQLEKDW